MRFFVVKKGHVRAYCRVEESNGRGEEEFQTES
jgi:hypothetical protein